MTTKEMTYSKDRKNELLDSGKCLEFNYYILNLGSHPVAYIEIPKYHTYYQKHYDSIDIDVYGGLTYSSDKLYVEDKVLNGWFIGWDYAHYGDYIGYEELYPIEFRTNGKKWTVKEIQEEVFKVCKQLKKFSQKG